MGMKRILHWMFNRGDSKRIILKNVQRNNGVVYGASAAQIRMGALARPTTDVDAFVRNPKMVAMQTEKQLDNSWGKDQFYVKQAKHKGTYKIKNKGFDMKKGTKDDFTVADFSNPPRQMPPYNNINGLNVVRLSHIQQTKSQSLKDPRYKFRHPKDSEDINRIKFFNKKL